MPKIAIRIFLVSVVLAVLAGAFLVRGRKGMVDFQVNYQAAGRLRAGETLYRQEDGHYQFKYPPFSAMIYLPVSLVPLDAAKALWFALALSCSFLAFRLSFLLVGPSAKARWIALVFPPLILAKFFLREIQLGQINAIITSLLLMMILLLLKNERGPASPAVEAAAGGLWGFSTAIKPYTAIFFPYWVLKGRWRPLLAGAATGALAFLAPSLFYGLPGNLSVHREWIESLSKSTPLLFTTQDNISLIAFFAKITGDPSASKLLYLASLVFLALLTAGLMALGRDRKDGLVLEAALLMALVPLASPLGWDYTLLSTVLAITLILGRFDSYPRWAQALFGLNAAVMGLSLYDLMGRSLYAKFMALSIPTANAMVIIGFLVWLRLKGRA